jgi:hypothetical protein
VRARGPTRPLPSRNRRTEPPDRHRTAGDLSTLSKRSSRRRRARHTCRLAKVNMRLVVVDFDVLYDNHAGGGRFSAPFPFRSGM